MIPLPDLAPDRIGVILIDHGSRRAESNRLLLDVVDMYREAAPFTIVEAAHMELAEPSLAQAFARCLEQGAQLVVIHPFFLFPGRHWDEDIPALAADAARHHPGVPFLVTAPLGKHPALVDVIQDRVGHCLRHACGKASSCEVCEGSDRCQIREM